MFETEQTVLAAFADGEVRDIFEVVEETGVHPVGADQTCQQLHRQGYLAATARGRYVITDDGRSKLEPVPREE